MAYKYFYIIFLTINFQSIEPKSSYAEKVKSFFRDPDNKKMLLNVAAGAAFATGVSLLVSYRHELVQLLWGDGYYYVDPFVNPILIGDYACKGLEREYRGIKIKQIRIPQQSGAQCGLYAFTSAQAWLYKDDHKDYVTKMQDSQKVTELIKQLIQDNEEVKKVKGQWLEELHMLQLKNNIDNEKDSHIEIISNKKLILNLEEKIEGSGEKALSYKEAREQEEIKKNKQDTVLYKVRERYKELANSDETELRNYSIIMGTMDVGNYCGGHWFAMNIAVKPGELEVIITDSLNGDCTNNSRVLAIIDSLVD